MKADDVEGRVIYLSSFSKTLAPGFRVAWIDAPAPIAAKLEMAKQAADLLHRRPRSADRLRGGAPRHPRPPAAAAARALPAEARRDGRGAAARARRRRCAGRRRAADSSCGRRCRPASTPSGCSPRAVGTASSTWRARRSSSTARGRQPACGCRSRRRRTSGSAKGSRGWPRRFARSSARASRPVAARIGTATPGQRRQRRSGIGGTSGGRSSATASTVRSRPPVTAATTASGQLRRTPAASRAAPRASSVRPACRSRRRTPAVRRRVPGHDTRRRGRPARPGR